MSATRFWQWRGSTLVLACQVQPGAAQDRIVGEHGGRLRVRVHAPPAEGAANARLCGLLSEAFGVSATAVVLQSGHASRFNTFCREYLNPFLNFHRPCLFATDKPDSKKPGRIKRVYHAKDAITPLDKLANLPEAAKFLREGITLKDLHQLATALTDVQAAEELNEARAALFRRVPARTG